MTRVESIMYLLEVEATERLKSRKDHDYASAVYEVDLEVSAAALDIMDKYRSFQREALKWA